MGGGDWKAMFKGIQDRDVELVRFYLRSGIDPNYQHPEYMTLPLAESIRYRHLEITEALLEYGAQPMLIDMESRCTPLALAIRRGDVAVATLIQRFIDVQAIK